MTQEEPISSAARATDAYDQRTMTRADLAEAVHLRTGLGRTDSAKYVEMVLDEIFKCIAAREEVKLSSFGAFLIRPKKERQGRNPKTGQGAKITARLVVSFKPSNVLRARINGDGAVVDDMEEAPPKANGAARTTNKQRRNGKSN